MPRGEKRDTGNLMVHVPSYNFGAVAGIVILALVQSVGPDWNIWIDAIGLIIASLVIAWIGSKLGWLDW